MSETLHTILYVEDDANIAETAVMALEDLGGFNVTHCSSGREALQQIEGVAPQLILMDVMMPGMDGPETLTQLRRLPGIRDIPVVFMTAKAQKHEQDAYLALGAVGVVVKPYDPLTLSSDIVEMWQRARANPGR